MKILFTRFPLESAYGGAEVQVLSLMEGLIKQDHKVRFFGSCPILLRECKRRKIPVTQLTIGPPPVTKWGAVSFLWRQKGMKKLLEQAVDHLPKADAVIMLSLTEKLLLTEIENRTRVFWLEHDRVGRWLTKNPWLNKLKKLSNNVTTVVVSELSRKIYVKLGFPENKVIAIPNGIDTKRLVEIEDHTFDGLSAGESQVASHKMHIGCVSRLTKDKGVDLLVDAVKDIRGIDLTIVGSGRDEEEIKKKINPNPNPISIISRIENLSSFYESLDLLVLPSREHDPFGLVVAEAMMLGVPAVVTDACGIADYLANGKDAIVVKANSSGALKRGILQVIDNADLRNSIAKTGKKTAQKQFTSNRMVERYCKLLEDNQA